MEPDQQRELPPCRTHSWDTQLKLKPPQFWLGKKRSISTAEYFRWNRSLKKKNQQNKISHKPHMSPPPWGPELTRDSQFWCLSILQEQLEAPRPLLQLCTTAGTGTAKPLSLSSSLNSLNSKGTENIRGLTNVCRIYGTGPSHPFTSQTSV